MPRWRARVLLVSGKVPSPEQAWSWFIKLRRSNAAAFEHLNAFKIEQASRAR